MIMSRSLLELYVLHKLYYILFILDNSRLGFDISYYYILIYKYLYFCFISLCFFDFFSCFQIEY